MNDRRLLIISCSNSKLATPGLLSAWDRYQGRVFSALRRVLLQGEDEHNIDIIIISAKYGYLRPSDKIEHYDQQMTVELAQGHKLAITEAISNLIRLQSYKSCFVLLEPTYLLTIGDLGIPDTHIEQQISQESLERMINWIMRSDL